MVEKAVQEANTLFEEAELPQRFSSDIKSGVYEIYLSTKEGEPKEEYPPFELEQSVKAANTKSRFTIIYDAQAVSMNGNQSAA